MSGARPFLILVQTVARSPVRSPGSHTCTQSNSSPCSVASLRLFPGLLVDANSFRKRTKAHGMILGNPGKHTRSRLVLAGHRDRYGFDS